MRSKQHQTIPDRMLYQEAGHSDLSLVQVERTSVQSCRILRHNETVSSDGSSITTVSLTDSIFFHPLKSLLIGTRPFSLSLMFFGSYPVARNRSSQLLLGDAVFHGRRTKTSARRAFFSPLARQFTSNYRTHFVSFCLFRC